MKLILILFQILPIEFKKEDIKPNLLVTHIAYVVRWFSSPYITTKFDDYEYGTMEYSGETDETFHCHQHLNRVLKFVNAEKASGYVYYFFESTKALQYECREGHMSVKLITI
jgi:hypothetical protein